MLELVEKTLLLVFLFIVAMFDIKTKQVSSKLCGIFAVCAIVLLIVSKLSGREISIFSYIGGILIGVLFIVVAKISAGAIGAGDGMVMAVAGLYVGFERNLEILFIAFLAAALVGIILWITRKKKRKETMAFLPFILTGYLASLI
ncbi:MAG: prepilin peptidase [Lachnospiraceae bacterium]|nr:prepilin peptidase [Lachnospiraceae bacterium]